MSPTGRSELAACLALVLATAGCAPVGDSAAEDVLTIGAYSVVREALHEGLLPAFAARWRAATGRGVRFEESYNGSGAQSRAIAAGFDADVAILSLEADVASLVEAGFVAPSWKDGPSGGMVTRSLVVIAVRPENPRGIEEWADLTKPGVGVLYPDPKTSGGARWNIDAIYGAGLLGDGPGPPDPSRARRLLAAVQENVVNMDSSGRQSLATFERGIGDAAVTYEYELRLRADRAGPGADVGFASILPSRTLLIEGPAALIEPSVDRHGNRALARAFLDFLRSESGQAILVDYGFRPLDRPPPPGTFTMADLGGWEPVERAVFGRGGLWTSIFTDRPGAR